MNSGKKNGESFSDKQSNNKMHIKNTNNETEWQMKEATNGKIIQPKKAEE